jgi:hypothetical protein
VHNTRRIIANWFRSLAATAKCRRATWAPAETEDRAVRIDTACPGCVCELVPVGRHGSPGVVKSAETLYSVLIAPADLDGEQIEITVITHAEKKGMSVLRESASNGEFEKIITDRIKGLKTRRFYGVAPIICYEVRSLLANENERHRSAGDRLYYVLDTDMIDLPHHADIFATVPHPYDEKTAKAAWRVQRARLRELMRQGFLGPDEFRGGAHASHAHPASDNTS